jgi:hypothetical protein
MHYLIVKSKIGAIGMKQVTGDIWNFWESGEWVAITTNGQTRDSDGTAVMGRGVAKQAADRFPGLPKQLAYKLNNFGNHVFIFLKYRIVTFPTKNDWRNPSDIGLIRQSCQELKKVTAGRIYLPRPGCSNGQLSWEQVRPVLEDELKDDWFIVVNFEEGG